MTVSLKGFNENNATFKTSGTVVPGQPVKFTAGNTVSPCSADDEFIGIAVNVRNGCACIQLTGYALVPYTGTAPDAGFAKLCANGSGGVKTSATGRTVLVNEIDAANNTIGIIM